ncbi:hypothetical protein Sru01_58480 [Sphaerisporangium rufum]|uniref:Subtilisin inhibitor domain-containing protein n=1 Tax=Sphaerisporangium rufum TaxID=1381558 RepID=A0A919R9E9_9ACTN|nr:SSI family serine proteinase inhibitor [Sphaerisporangium rufum]GII80866.1 hypothetical protein Sru01_58480 [Sphaerisporangium rufum]
MAGRNRAAARTALLAVPAILLTAAIPAPAPARPAIPAPPAATFPRWLLLARTPGVIPWPPDRVALLTCAPPGGTHPYPAAACAVLTPVQGDLLRLVPRRNVVCPDEYDPVTVLSTGKWDGKTVRSLRVYGNACEMNRNLGVVALF